MREQIYIVVVTFAFGALSGGIYIASGYQRMAKEREVLLKESQETSRTCLCSLVNVEPVVQSVWPGWQALDEVTRTRLGCSD